MFVIPPEAFKSKRAHIVVLNDTAWSIVDAQRGLHPIWVFPYRGKRVSTMNNTAWQRARREAGLRSVRIHDLRHTFACRLRAAGVTAEDREVLLGHANHSMAGHYASADTPPSPARLIVLYHSNELNRQRAKVAESNVERRREWQLEHAGVRARRNDLTRLQTFVARREKIREPY